ncbi:FAD-dependent oxidoreductase [Lacticaseibacillus brantae]|uniref:Putative NAD(FAD)-dependent dehydrogenase n=1 Tax=Lacticaseibacillus brantae DSM 23927 TaxID=1423727 RepID=A0A0R2AXJ8_9LACO|nr:FAD-dependent oxidoreductase [Lacticaseibacillus brantae]KRM71744.1 putative NAD(FAD)-dependent dehydrogenase [Lacticaseibacillus brantae DSM 23927]
MKVIVVGSTHAGTAAVQEIINQHPETEVTVYERRPDISFLSCGIALYLGGEVHNLDDLFLNHADVLEKSAPKLHFQLEHDVTHIDAANHTVTVVDLKTNAQFTDHYDKLVFSAGSYPVIPPLQGVTIPRVLLCKSYDDAVAIHKTAATASKILIIGGGYIGVELAEAYSHSGKAVGLINGVRPLLSHYADQEVSQRVRADLEDHGVTLYDETALKFDGDDHQVFVQTDLGEHQADLAIVCVGFRPMTELLHDQVAMNADDSVHVDDYMQTSNPDIFAAGDAVAVHFNPTGKDAYTPLATNAVRQGKLAGINLFKRRVKYMGTQATSALTLFGKTLASTGLTELYAKKSGFAAEAVTLTVNYRPTFMASTVPVLMRLVFDSANRQILGGQLYSEYDVSQSANLLSVMIQNRNTIDDLAYVDMLFNPHYDYPWHFLNLLGQAAVARADSTTQED